jgi:hypothetical protein
MIRILTFIIICLILLCLYLKLYRKHEGFQSINIDIDSLIDDLMTMRGETKPELNEGQIEIYKQNFKKIFNNL